MSDRISILMATYNGEAFVAEQIQSIQGQTHEDWQLYVSDDGSTDRTLEIVRELAADDPRIHVLVGDERFGGAKENFAHLIANAPDGYVALADQDDVWHPDKLARCLQEMKAIEAEAGEDTPVLVGSDLRIVDEQLGELHPSFLEFYGRDPRETGLTTLLSSNILPGCTMLLNDALVAKARGPIQDDRAQMHDWLLMLIAQSTGRVSILPDALMGYRQHSHNTLGAPAQKGVLDVVKGKAREAGGLAGLLSAPAFEDALDQARLLKEVVEEPVRADDAVALDAFTAFQPARPLHNAALMQKSGVHDLKGRDLVMRYGAVTHGLFGAARPDAAASVSAPWPGDTVAAGIVTYNPEIGQLRESLEAVSPQVSRMFVFDNGSDNQADVRALAREFPTLEVFACPDNLGLAGALNTLAAACQQSGAAWGFFLDQDSVVEPHMVAALLETARLVQEDEGNVGQVGPVLVEHNLGAETTWGGEGPYRLVNSVITSGSLLNLDAWEAVDGYDEDLFVDWVDFDLSFALHKAGYVVAISSGTTLVHEMGQREVVGDVPPQLDGLPVPFSVRTDDGRRVWFRYNYAPSRWYDQMRSMAIVAAKYQGTPDAEFVRDMTFGTALRAVVFEKDRGKVLGALVKGHRDGKAKARELARR